MLYKEFDMVRKLALSLDINTLGVFQKAHQWRYPGVDEGIAEKDHSLWSKTATIPEYVREFAAHCMSEWAYEEVML